MQFRVDNFFIYALKLHIQFIEMLAYVCKKHEFWKTHNIQQLCVLFNFTLILHKQSDFFQAINKSLKYVPAA